MKTFRCTCGNTLYFGNSQCLSCGRLLGFLPDLHLLSSLEPEDDGLYVALASAARDARYRTCLNYIEYNVCNWMIPYNSNDVYCQSCRLNHIIPDLSNSKNRVYWYRIETAKRWLIYSLLELGLPIVDRNADPERGLSFEFLADPSPNTEFSDRLGEHRRVMTGHKAGTITINIAEADSSAREQIREQMNEGYRTLLGHFRHEIGHYYWARLVEPTHWLSAARELFGDERTDYAEALERYYNIGPIPDWSSRHISAYASSHPWEDWAETWAHYLHIVDTLETAHDVGFTVGGRHVVTPKEIGFDNNASQLANNPFFRRSTFDVLLSDWIDLTIAMNALNRSMGLPDAYPFTFSDNVAEKLRFIHEVIRESATPTGRFNTAQRLS